MSSVLITGASGALGSAVVKRLAESGQRVVAVDRRADRLEPFAATTGVRLAAFDVMAAPAWDKALSDLGSDWEPGGAVLVAGSWRGGARFGEAGSDDTFRAMMESNLDTARVAIASLLPGMLKQRRGSIVVIGSRAAERPWESARAAAYAASKAALLALVQAIAAETLMDRVRINAVLPSTIDTPANRASMPDADFTRWVTPDSIAEVIGFLLSDASRDVSGAAIPVYGRA